MYFCQSFIWSRWQTALVTCELYDARRRHLKLTEWKLQDVIDMCLYLSAEEKHTPFSYLRSNRTSSSATHTVFENVPLGKTLGYQLIDLRKPKQPLLFINQTTALLTQQHFHGISNYREGWFFPRFQFLVHSTNHFFPQVTFHMQRWNQ